MNAMVTDLIYGVIYSEFDEVQGPSPRYFVPSSILNKKLGFAVAGKTIDIYDDADIYTASLAVIPFTSEGKKGFARFFDWNDVTKRGNKGMGSLTLLFDENKDIVFYKYMKDLEIIFKETIETIRDLKDRKANEDDVFNEVKSFYNNAVKLLNEITNQELGSKDGVDAFPDEAYQSLKYKIIICGDPGCGKTSTVSRFTDKAFRATYLPTLGVNVTEKVININDFTRKYLIDTYRITKNLIEMIYKGTDV